jgi:two-component system, NtrC family, response regulator AtoC
MTHVLLVEDDDAVRDILCDAIKAAGYTADCVKTKREAEALLAPGSHSLAICNVLLPDGLGYDVADKATALGITALLMTGHPSEMQAMAVAGVAHLQKPIRLQDFEKVLHDYLGP